MNKRSASLLVLVVLASLLSLGFDSQRNPATTSKRSARANVSAARKSAAPPAAAPTNIGFLSPGRNAANGAIFGIFPLILFFILAALLVHWLCMRTEFSKKIYKRMSLLQLVTMYTFLIFMVSLPIKILLRLVFTIKYIWVTPWFSI